MYRVGRRYAGLHLTPYQAFVEITDKGIYDAIVRSNRDDTFLVDRVQLLLAQYSKEGLYSQTSCITFLGRKFRSAMDLPERLIDALDSSFAFVELPFPAFGIPTLAPILFLFCCICSSTNHCQAD